MTEVWKVRVKGLTTVCWHECSCMCWYLRKGLERQGLSNIFIFQITTGCPKLRLTFGIVVGNAVMLLMWWWHWCFHCISIDRNICVIWGIVLDLWRWLKLGFIRVSANHILVLGVEARTVNPDSALQSQGSFLVRFPQLEPWCGQYHRLSC